MPKNEIPTHYYSFKKLLNTFKIIYLHCANYVKMRRKLQGKKIFKIKYLANYQSKKSLLMNCMRAPGIIHI